MVGKSVQARARSTFVRRSRCLKRIVRCAPESVVMARGFFRYSNLPSGNLCKPFTAAAVGIRPRTLSSTAPSVPPRRDPKLPTMPPSCRSSTLPVRSSSRRRSISRRASGCLKRASMPSGVDHGKANVDGTQSAATTTETRILKGQRAMSITGWALSNAA